MKLHESKAVEGSRRVHNRAGRGAATSNGKTGSYGQKGQKARSGGKIRPGFESRQLPLFHRLPRCGFTNINREERAIVNLDQLNKFEGGTEVTPTLLVESGVVKNEKSGIKVLGSGSLDKRLIVKVYKLLASAVETIDAKSGVHGVI